MKDMSKAILVKILKRRFSTLNARQWCRKSSYIPASQASKNVSREKHEFLFGVGPCHLALRNGRRTVYKIYIREGALNTERNEFFEIQTIAKELGIPILPSTRKKLSFLSEGRPAQNIVMAVSPLKFSKFHNQKDPVNSEIEDCKLFLALDEVQDPMNFGAIIRTSSLLGVSGIVVPIKNSAPLSPVVSKASAGAMEIMDIFQVPEIDTFLKDRASSGWDVLGAVQPKPSKSIEYIKPVDCCEFTLKRPTVLVLGNEGSGLQDHVLKHCTQLVSIYPWKKDSCAYNYLGPDSFNVSVAAGILIFSILKSSQKSINTETPKRGPLQRHPGTDSPLVRSSAD